MKQILLPLAAALLISVTAVNAQTGETGNRNQKTQKKTTQTKTSTQQDVTTPQQDAGTQWRADDRQQVKREDLPPSVVEALNSSEHQGWENASIYRNKRNNEYMVVISDGDRPKTLYFDQEGKKMQSDPNHTGSLGNDQSRTNTYGTGTQGSQNDQYRSNTQGTGTGTSGNGYGSNTQGTGTTGTTGTGNDNSQYRSNTQQGTGTTGSTGTTGTGGNDQYRSSTGSTGMTGTGTTGTTAGTTGTAGAQPQIRWSPEERIEVSREQIPSPLKVTLGDTRYKGWEKSTIYRNRNTNEYLVVINDGNSAKLYYFDKSGKAMPDNK